MDTSTYSPAHRVHASLPLPLLLTAFSHMRNVAFLLLAAVDLLISSTVVYKKSTFRIPNHIPVRNIFTN